MPHNVGSLRDVRVACVQFLNFGFRRALSQGSSSKTDTGKRLSVQRLSVGVATTPIAAGRVQRV